MALHHSYGLILLDIVEDVSKLKELKSIRNNVEILYRNCDVSNAQDLVEAYNYSWNHFGYIHLAVHSAGINDEDNSRRLVSVNIAGVIDGSMWLWNKMRQNAGGEGGTLINVSSITGIVAVPLVPIYSTTKHAVRVFSECLGNSLHYNKSGVRVLTVCPGLTQTPMSTKHPQCIDGSPNEMFGGFLKTLTFQKPESVAKVILEMYRNAASGTAWVAYNNLPAIQHLPRDDKEIIEAYFK